MGNGSTEIVVLEDHAALSQKAAEILLDRITEVLDQKPYFSLALSGGSTPKALFSMLADDESFREKIPWDKIHFFWGDERHVAPQDEQSNYRMAYELMLAKVPVQAEHIHRLPTEHADTHSVADAYQQELCRFFQLAADQLPEFDFILLGIGSDGHTASLFPGTQALGEKQRLVVANWVEKLQAHRITLTVPVINNADMVVFLGSGREKAEVIQKVLEGDFQPDLLPAQLIQPGHGRLIWLLDRPAAKHLNPPSTRRQNP